MKKKKITRSSEYASLKFWITRIGILLGFLLIFTALAQISSEEVYEEDEEEVFENEEDYGDYCSPEECEDDYVPERPAPVELPVFVLPPPPQTPPPAPVPEPPPVLITPPPPEAPSPEPPAKPTPTPTPAPAPQPVLTPEQRETQRVVFEVTRETQIELSTTTIAQLKQEIKTAAPSFQRIIASSSAGSSTLDTNTDTDRDGIPDNIDSDSLNADKNNNGVTDGVEQRIGGNPFRVDREDVALRAEVTISTKKLIAQGLSQKEAEKLQKQTLRKKRAEKKQAKIRRASTTVIKDNVQDSNKDGVSDEVEVTLGLNPAETPMDGLFPSAERKIYSANSNLIGKKCTTGLYSGYTLSDKGFSVLASCPSPQKSYTLYAMDTQGRETPLESRQASDNRKLVFNITDDVPSAGTYALIVKPTVTEAKDGFISRIFGLDQTAKAADSASESAESSEPVLVKITSDVEVSPPIVEKIQEVHVAGLSDIRVQTTEDGRIRVTGKSDTAATVIGTFSSAIFTSAMLADIESGSFSIVSAQPLPEGKHEVTLYATHPEEAIQSPPSRIAFSIIPTANAAAIYSAPETEGFRGSSDELISPEKSRINTIVWILSGLATMFIALSIYTKEHEKKE